MRLNKHLRSLDKLYHTNIKKPFSDALKCLLSLMRHPLRKWYITYVVTNIQGETIMGSDESPICRNQWIV